ncbi:MAG: hypothetical protein VKP62_15565, partial [Candidatus Sericytochromatia bacterium]|nr:hypothetical protein [Candidatus Sericytochromatia bacterium]
MTRIGFHALLALSLALSACNTRASTQTKPNGAASAKPAAGSNGSGKNPSSVVEAPKSLAAGLDSSLKRLVDQGIARTITGKVKLVSDAGGSLVSDAGGSLVSDAGGSLVSPESGRILSNNSGGLIGNNSAGLVSNNGGGLISNNSGGLIGKTKFFRLFAQSVVAEDLLADALVEVFDASGKVLTDAAGNPLQVLSDKQGRFTLETRLPNDNLILRVKLNNKLGGAEGELRAMVATKGSSGTLALDIDTSATLAANYVFDQYVKGQQGVFNRLPADANRDLRNEVEKARALLPVQVPSYAPATMVGTIGSLRQQAKPLDTTLERVKALLLVGQENLGQGLKATEVPLALPVAVARDAAGNTYIAESVAGRIRKVTPEGTISVLAGDNLTGKVQDGAKAADVTFETISDMAVEADGSLLVVERSVHRLVRLTPDGRVQIVAGTGTAGTEGEGGPAKQAALAGPTGVCVATNGTIYLTEENPSAPTQSRVLAIGKDGILRAVSLRQETLSGKREGPFNGVTMTPDGALWVTTTGAEAKVLRWAAGSEMAEMVARKLNLGYNTRLLAAPDNGVYVTESGGDRLLKLMPDGTLKKLTGPGEPGELRNEGALFQSLEAEAAMLRRPAGMASLPDGRLLVVDVGHMQVRLFDPAQPSAGMPVFAGSTGITTVGTAQAIAVNAPAGLTMAPDGKRLVFTEAGGSVVKQLVDGQVSVLAGGRTAAWADGGPAVTAGLIAPVAVAYDRGGNLWIAESSSPRILKVTPAGAMFHVAGNGQSMDLAGKIVPVFDPAGKPARELQLGRPVALAVGPDDRPYWVDQAFNVVCRLSADNQVEVVAGQTPAPYGEGADGGDGGPARAARFHFPTSLAFDRQGALYVTDSLNFKLRKIDMNAQPPTIQTLGGLGMAGTVMAMVAGKLNPEEGKPLAGQALIAPIGLHVDGKNRLYLVEAGTVRLTSVLNSFNSTQLPPTLPLVPARIRRIDLNQPDLPVVTITGPGGRVLTETRGDQVLGLPLGLTIDPTGRLVLADALNNQIRLVP